MKDLRGPTFIWNAPTAKCKKLTMWSDIKPVFKLGQLHPDFLVFNKINIFHIHPQLLKLLWPTAPFSAVELTCCPSLRRSCLPNCPYGSYLPPLNMCPSIRVSWGCISYCPHCLHCYLETQSLLLQRNKKHSYSTVTPSWQKPMNIISIGGGFQNIHDLIIKGTNIVLLQHDWH